MKIHLHYFAVFREQAGCRTELLETNAKTFAELYRECAEQHGFRLPPDQVRVALDNEYIDMNKALTDGMQVTFIPPVAGG